MDVKLLRRVFDFAPVTSLYVAALIVVGFGVLFAPAVFGFLWFFLMLPAYLLLLKGVAVGAVFGAWGPPLVSLALCVGIDVVLRVAKA